MRNFWTDDNFQDARQALNAVMRATRAEGIGLHKKRSEEISRHHEDQLWSKGVFGFDDLVKLVRTLILYFGLVFVLRARSEHRALKCGNKSQFKLVQQGDEECLIYEEAVPKNNSGGLNVKGQPKLIKYLQTTATRNVLFQCINCT